MNKVPDRAKLRREYVWKKTKVIIPAIFTGSISLLLVASVLKIAFQPSTMSDSQLAAFVLFLVLMVPCTIIIILCEKRALSIPYVPPIREQIPTLPADEILLRGSQASPASPEELLRASTVTAETNVEELLRADSAGE